MDMKQREILNCSKATCTCKYSEPQLIHQGQNQEAAFIGLTKMV